MKTIDTNSPDTLLTRAQVAKRLLLHPRTLRRWCASGRLPSVTLSPRVVRYRLSDVDRLLRSYQPANHSKPGPKAATP